MRLFASVNLILLLASIALTQSCLTVNPYHCPATTDERYREMDDRDQKHLTRKPNKYKRRFPRNGQQEGFGDIFDYKD